MVVAWAEEMVREEKSKKFRSNDSKCATVRCPRNKQARTLFQLLRTGQKIEFSIQGVPPAEVQIPTDSTDWLDCSCRHSPTEAQTKLYRSRRLAGPRLHAVPKSQPVPPATQYRSARAVDDDDEGRGHSGSSQCLDQAHYTNTTAPNPKSQHRPRNLITAPPTYYIMPMTPKLYAAAAGWNFGAKISKCVASRGCVQLCSLHSDSQSGKLKAVAVSRQIFHPEKT